MLELPASKGANEMNSEIDIKLVSQEDEEQVHRLRDYCFRNKYTGARRDDFQYWVRHSTVIGAYDKKELVGKLLILPLNITVHGVNYVLIVVAVCIYLPFVAMANKAAKTGKTKGSHAETSTNVRV